jgi:hypothetical protein
MFEFPLLLAVDIGDILKVIGPLVLLIFWVLSQVFGQKKPDAPPAGNPRPQQPGNGGGLREEIERFLREAKQQQEQQEQTPREREMGQQGSSSAEEEKKKKQERHRRKEEKQREAARQRAKDMAASNRRIQTEPEIIEDVIVVSQGSSVSQHVSSYMDSSKFRESASHLGEQVGQADERLSAHLNQAFAHQVGNLAGQPNEVERGGAAVIHSVVSGGQIATMLHDPRMFRHAIVLNEILTRPEHRWQ